MKPKDRTVNDAKTGDYVTLAGARWQVIGYHDRMTALLAKEGCEQMPVGQRTHHSVCLGSMESRDCLLSPTDQGEAGIEWGPPIEVNGKRPEWLVDGVTHIRIRADHPHYQQPDWTPCERTVRLCIETLPDVSATSAADMQAESIGIERCREALESLLPKQPDPAEELVREFESDPATPWGPGEVGCKESIALDFARWLVSKEKLA